MKFTKIRRLESFGMHKNISIEAELEEGDDLEQCDIELQLAIQSRIESKGIEELRNERFELINSIEILKQDSDRLEELRNSKIPEPGMSYFVEEDIPF